MATSIFDREPQVQEAIPTVSGESVRLTATGLDESGQMFREAAPILNLNRRDCTFRSKFQPEVSSWMLIEIDLSNHGAKRSTLQGQVRSVQAEGVATGLFRVRVELESPQEVKIVSSPEKPEVSATELPSKPIIPAKKGLDNSPNSALSSLSTASKTPNTEPIVEAAVPSKPVPMKPTPSGIEQSVVEAPAITESVKNAAAVDTNKFDRDAAKLEIASEVSGQLAELKIAFSQELEQITQRMIASSLEQVVRPAIESQISVSYQAAIQTLNNDLACQLVGRVASSEELRACIEKMAKGAFSEQLESSRSATIEAQQNLDSRLGEITRKFDASMADIESKMETTRNSVQNIVERAQTLEAEATETTRKFDASMAGMESKMETTRNSVQNIVERAQTLEAEATETTRKFDASMAGMEERVRAARDIVQTIVTRAQTLETETAEHTLNLQKIGEQVNQAARSTIEKFDAHITAQLNSWSVQFKKHLDEVSKEKSAQFAGELQHRMASSTQDANDVLEKLAAGLQMVRGALRKQEEQLTGFSRHTAAEFEKEIKAVLLRFAGSVQS